MAFVPHVMPWCGVRYLGIRRLGVHHSWRLSFWRPSSWRPSSWRPSSWCPSSWRQSFLVFIILASVILASVILASVILASYLASCLASVVLPCNPSSYGFYIRNLNSSRILCKIFKENKSRRLMKEVILIFFASSKNDQI